MRRSLLAVTSIIGAVAADWTYNMMFSSWAVSNKYDRYHTFTPESADLPAAFCWAFGRILVGRLGPKGITQLRDLR